MRTLAIVTTAASSLKESRRHFIDTISKTIIQCAFNHSEDCGPDCAACCRENLETVVTCDRIGDKDSLIGILPLKEKK